MSDYRIKTDTEDLKLESIKLLGQLGFTDEGEHERLGMVGTYKGKIFSDRFKHFDGRDYVGDIVTVEQLRDLIVLKRNNVGDATHTDQDNWKWYIGADSYVWQAGNAQQLKQWDKSSVDHVDLKPIGAVMKEYLDPRNGYKLSEALEPHASEWIEVPEGAEVYCYWRIDNAYAFHKSEVGIFEGGAWINESAWRVDQILGGKSGAKILWQRNTQPVIDDEPFLTPESVAFETMTGHQLDATAAFMGFRRRSSGETDESYREYLRGFGKIESLNDQYAEIEKARQANTETDYLMQGKNGEKLMESLAQFKNTDHGAEFDSFELLEDNVNHPSHYTNGKVECIDALESATVGKKGIEAVCVANVIKYLWRYEDKNGLEDIKKAKWYLEKLINTLE